MKLIWAIGLFLLVCGPLRPWVGRHWALLVSLTVGGALGLIAAGWVMATTRQSFPGLAGLLALIGAAVCGREGPAILRHLQKDGKDHGPTPRR